MSKKCWRRKFFCGSTCLTWKFIPTRLVTFEQVWKNKVKKRFGKTVGNFAGLDELIKMKRAANRVRDREDLKALLAIKKIRKQKTPLASRDALQKKRI